jgi:ribosomal protein L6P/L9E
VDAPTVTVNTDPRARSASTLIIHGTGFDPTAADNRIELSLGAVGVVTAATSTQLTVTLSTQPTATGPLTAVVTSFGGSSGAPVQVANVVDAPTVTVNTDRLARSASTLIIHGTGFDPTAAGNSVELNLGAAGVVTAATSTQLTVTLSTQPTAMGPLIAAVTSFGGSSGAPMLVAFAVDAPTVTLTMEGRAQNVPTLIIRGTGFDPTAADNRIELSLGAVGIVTAASTTQLNVTLSTQPTATGPLTAVVTSFGGSSGAPVQVATVMDVPTVIENTDLRAQTAKMLFIHGTGFDPTAAGNSVEFNLGAAGVVTAATATQLTVRLSTRPTAAGPLTAVVTSFSGASGAAVQVAAVVVVPTVTASQSTTCALPAGNGDARCWGRLPMRYLFSSAASVAAGNDHVCATLESGLESGQAACNSIYSETYAASDVPGDLGPVAYVAAGDEVSCALTARGGRVRCFGSNKFELLNVPGDLGPATSVVVGSFFACAVRTDGLVRCWGKDFTHHSGEYNPPAHLGPVKSLALSYNHACAITARGKVICWGGCVCMMCVYELLLSICVLFELNVFCVQCGKKYQTPPTTTNHEHHHHQPPPSPTTITNHHHNTHKHTCQKHLRRPDQRAE